MSVYLSQETYDLIKRERGVYSDDKVVLWTKMYDIIYGIIVGNFTVPSDLKY